MQTRSNYDPLRDSSTHDADKNMDEENSQTQGQESDSTQSETQLGSTVQFLSKQYFCIFVSLFLLTNLTIINFVLLINRPIGQQGNSNLSQNQQSTVGFVAKKIAFGSCTSYDLRDWKIFTDAILPAKPDAWIWLGDMVYLDDNEINCNTFENSKEWQQSCNCSADWIHSPPYSCHAGDIEYANQRWIAALNNNPYSEFLEYMCPGSLSKGYFPPEGTNPLICPKPILGIYDDHDFGWNNGNKREPQKREYKNLFLDAIGEPRDSLRRNENRGAWTQYAFNQQVAHKDIDVFVLDERYERDPLPCATRRAYCETVLLYQHNLTIRSHWQDAYTTGKVSSPPSSNEIAWCQDFLYDGKLGQGTCCSQDEQFHDTWCQNPQHVNHTHYATLCDVTHPTFGMQSFGIDPITQEVWTSEELLQPGSPVEGMDLAQTSPFCELLGRNQRKWLRQAVQQSTAAIQVFVSGSVLLYNPLPYVCGWNPITLEPIHCTCGGDNVDCYPVAQEELLHLISSVQGCAIVLTGDYHFSDIKQLTSTSSVSSLPYPYRTTTGKPISQIMSSGMTFSTAKNVTCGDYRLDPLGLRMHPECAFVRGPNFGQIVLDYDETQSNGPLEAIRLQILSGTTAHHVLLETIIDPVTCKAISSTPPK